MPNHSPAQLTLNPALAAAAQPGLEQTVRELQECLDRLAGLQDSFREKFLQLFAPEASPNDGGRPAGPGLSNVYFFTQANLGGSAVSHLRYAADLADLACGLLAEATRDQA